MKKQFKRVISSLVCIIMMLSMTIPVTFAEHNDGLYVMVSALEDGKTTDFYASVDYGDDDRYDVYDYNRAFFVGGVRICDLTTGNYITSRTVVNHEHDYKYEVILAVKAGYGIPEYNGNPSVKGYITVSGVNGDVDYDADVQWFEGNKDKIILSCEYNARITESINSVSLNIPSPKQGEYPSYDIELLSDNIESNLNFDDGEYCINGISWYYADNTWDPIWLGEQMPKDEVFVGGHNYRLTVRIAAKQDYARDTERKFGFSFAPHALNNKLLVNGISSRGEESKPTPEAPYYVDSQYIIYRDFYCPVLNTVKDVALEIDPPMLDHNPDFDVAFGNTGYKLVEKPDEDGFINGVKWRDLTAAENLTEDDVFIDGHRYSFSAYIEPADEKTTLAVDSYGGTTVTGTMNGNKASITSGIVIYGNDPMGNDSRAIAFDYIFEAVPNEITRVAVFDIDEPVAGAAADYTASIKNKNLYNFDTDKDDTEYVVNGISWSNNSTGEKIDQFDTFEVGNQYSVTVYLTISDRYTMGNTVTASINGMDSLAYAIGGKNKLALVYTFGDVEPIKTGYNKALGLNAPAEGDHPYYDVALDNSNSTISDIRWRDVSVSSNGACLAEGETFVGGHIYQLELDIVPDENHEFMTDEAGDLAFEFLFNVNGVDYEGAVDGTKENITATYRFAPLLVSSVDVAIDVPAPDFEPSFLAYLSNDACYVNEIVWYDKTDDVYINYGDDYTFEEGHIYVVTVDIFTEDGRCFDAYSDKLVGTVNNNPAEIASVVYPNEGTNVLTVYSMFYAMRFSYEFEPCAYENVLTADFDSLTGLVSVSHEIQSSFEEDAIMLYMAFYDNNNRLLSVIDKKVVWANDSHGETAADDAVYCKAMLWNKKTMEPLCDAASCETVKEEL